MKNKVEYHVVAIDYAKSSKPWVAEIRYTEKAGKQALKRWIKARPMSVHRWYLIKIETTLIERWPNA